MKKASSRSVEKNTMLKKAAIYARVSSLQQKEEETIDSQIDILKTYAKENDYHIDDRLIFLDNGVSGGTLQRPALDELRDIIRFETIEILLIYAPDRLSRNYTHQLILMEEFKKHGVKICFFKTPPEVNTPEAKMFQHFQGIFAEYERALILDRSRRGRYYKAKQGNPSVIPSLPYGYKKIKNENEISVVIVEEEAIVVKEIYRLYVHEAKSLQEVAKKITLKGIKPRKGGSQWDRATIRDILRNPTYTGTSYFGKTERCEGVSNRIRKYGSKTYTKAKYGRKKRLQEDWLAINVPPMISENDFEEVQEKLKNNKNLANRNTKKPSLLQGLVICGICGEPFYKRIRRNGDRSIGYYYCRANVEKTLKKCFNKALRQEAIDKHVFEEVLKLLKTPKLIQQELERRAQETSNVEELAQREVISKKELAKLSYERDRLLDAYQSGLIELEELKKRNKNLDEHKRNIEKDIKGLQAIKFQQENTLDLGNLFENILQHVQGKANKLSFDEKRNLIRLLVDQVIVHKDMIEITHCISPLAISREKCQLRLGVGLKPIVIEPEAKRGRNELWEKRKVKWSSKRSESDSIKNGLESPSLRFGLYYKLHVSHSSVALAGSGSVTNGL